MRSRTRSSQTSEGRSPLPALSRGRKSGLMRTESVALPASVVAPPAFVFDIQSDEDDELAAANPKPPVLMAGVVSRRARASDSSRTVAPLSLRSIIGASESPGPAPGQTRASGPGPGQTRASITSRKSAPRNLRSIMGTSESPPLPGLPVDLVRPTLRRQALVRPALKKSLSNPPPQQTPAAPAKSVTFGDDRMRGKVYSSTPRRFRQVYS